MKVAFVGKGGTGKSVLAGTVCRHLARRGLPVLALDVDTVPGLAFSLGGPREEARLPAGLAERVPEKGWRVVKGAGAARLVDRYSAKAPDGVRFLELGKLPGRVEPTVTVAFRHVMERFRRPGWAMIADLAAGTRQPMFGWTDFADFVIIVADASAKSRLTARRLRPLATHLVANKVRSDTDLAAITSTVGLPLLGVVPYDEMLAEAEQRGIAPIDFAPVSPAVVAAERLAERLMQETS
jgi:CO dehydrogenase maturation factor